MKKLLFLVFIFPFLVKGQPSGTPSLGKTLNIFTLGDSNGTFPYSWPQQLKTAIPGSDVFNISKSGKTVGFVNNGDSSLNALITLDHDLKRAADYTGVKPFDYIVISLGTNDAKAVFANQQDQVAGNLGKLIGRIKGSAYNSINKAKIIIISPPPYGSKAEAQAKYAGGNQRVQNMGTTFSQVAKKLNCLFVNGFATPGLDMEAMSADGLHLNAEGQGKMVAQITGIIR